MPATSWSQVDDLLWTLAGGCVSRDEISAWVAAMAKNARWLPPEATLELIMRAAITVTDERCPYCSRDGPLTW